jgi:hypothetical protein
MVRIYPLLGNGPVNTHSNNKRRFSVESVPRVQSTEYGRVRRSTRSTRDYNGVVEFSSVGSWNSSRGVSSRKKMSVCQ